MNKAQVKVVNTVASVDMDDAHAMLEGINLVLGTDYFFLNRRVCYADSNGLIHDLWANAEE